MPAGQANEVLFVDAEHDNEVLTFREVFLGSRALELLVAGCALSHLSSTLCSGKRRSAHLRASVSCLICLCCWPAVTFRNKPDAAGTAAENMSCLQVTIDLAVAPRAKRTADMPQIYGTGLCISLTA